MSAAHASTPWFAAAKKPGGQKAIVIADDSKSKTHMLVVAECPEMSKGNGPQEEANAAFIVKACNAHDDLVAALKRMLLEFDFLIEAGRIPDVRNDVIFVAARAALAKAGEP
jgi:hypothetical protein